MPASAPESSGHEFVALQEALVGRYSLERELGRGGMGVVYLAHEVALDRPVALKLLPPAYAAQPVLRERFLREARTAAKLSHPNIVPIHAVDEVGDFVFFAMAYVDGETLGERIRRQGPLPSKDAAKIIQEVAWALAYAHAEGVVHRDVKPDNILLERGSGRALVTDFGIAHVAQDARVTGAGEVLGTAEFMSPEQAAGEEVGPASDLYSLGVVGFYAVTGELPFQAPSVAAVLAKHLTQEPPSVASVAPGVPARLARAVDRCLLKEPDERFADGGALAEAVGRDAVAKRELPVPLRIFVNRTRRLAEAAPLILALWVLAGIIAISEPGFASRPALLVLALYFVAPLSPFWLYARRLLKAGYGVDDARLALEEDVNRRLEEIRFEYGKGLTGVDRTLRVLTWGGFLTMLVGMLASLAGIEIFEVAVLGANVGVISFFIAAFRNKRRRDLAGESLRAVFRSRIGEWVFRSAGVGVKKGALSAGEHRPTEMAIGMAADRLYHELPKALKRELRSLPTAMEKIEEAARRMRSHVAELDDVLAEIGDEPGRVEEEERARVRAEVEATRDEARHRLTDAVAALEKIRLGLLRLHAGEGDVDRLTAELGSAEALSADIERLLEGQAEVRRITEGRPTPPDEPSDAPGPAPAS